MVTKLGYIHLFALDAGTFIYSTRISSDGIFASAPQVSTGGVVAVSPQGHVFSICINKETIIPFLMNKLDYDLAMAMASKYDFAGGDDLFKTHLSRLLSSGDPEKATTIATNKYLTLQNEIEALKTQNVILQENIEKLEARRILSTHVVLFFHPKKMQNKKHKLAILAYRTRPKTTYYGCSKWKCVP